MPSIHPYAVACGPDATPSVLHEVSDQLDLLADRVLAVTGHRPQVKWWPYRYHGSKLWAFDVIGVSDSISLTFVETGRSRLPEGSIHDAIGELVDSVDAYYLLVKLAELLVSRPGAFP